tara:strand:+ start:1445 stop:1672 length:228 start_codon:yes stop_codon:yes gene_type:complete
MKKIVKYEVVSLELYEGLFTSEHTTENDFTELIDKKIKNGFQPYGELRISVETSGSFMGSSSTTRLSQVMVKYEE